MGLMLYYDSNSNRLVKEDSVARGPFINRVLYLHLNLQSIEWRI